MSNFQIVFNYSFPTIDAAPVGPHCITTDCINWHRQYHVYIFVPEFQYPSAMLLGLVPIFIPRTTNNSYARIRCLIILRDFFLNISTIVFADLFDQNNLLMEWAGFICCNCPIISVSISFRKAENFNANFGTRT